MKDAPTNTLQLLVKMNEQMKKIYTKPRKKETKKKQNIFLIIFNFNLVFYRLILAPYKIAQHR